jgi:hypothetical protein
MLQSCSTRSHCDWNTVGAIFFTGVALEMTIEEICEKVPGIAIILRETADRRDKFRRYDTLKRAALRELDFCGEMPQSAYDAVCDELARRLRL